MTGACIGHEYSQPTGDCLVTNHLAAFAAERGVKYFMISYTDLFGGQRAKLVPAQAMPLVAPKPVSDNLVETVQWGPPGPRPGRHWHRPPPRPGYYNGYRGYRYERPGHRYYNGYWFPLGAFAAGTIIGGAIAAPSRPAVRPSRVNPKHYDWCYSRYRSYDARSNTYQPNYGPRKQCLSPYY